MTYDPDPCTCGHPVVIHAETEIDDTGDEWVWADCQAEGCECKMFTSSLKLWNGRLTVDHWGFIAAYSLEDAQQVWDETRAPQDTARSWKDCPARYWSDGWTDAMIGITPERGLWAKPLDGPVMRIIDGQRVPATSPRS